MLAKSHVLTSLNVTLGASLLVSPSMLEKYYSYEDFIFFLIAIIVGSLLPDIDEQNSYIGRRFKLISFFSSVLGHRNLTHNCIFWFILLSVFMYFNLNFLSIICIGGILHIIEDMFTNGGVKNSLIPIYYKAIIPKKIRFNTNSKFEIFFYLPLNFLLLIYIFYYLYYKLY
jgi:inner membrane protein